MKIPALVLATLTMWAGFSHASDSRFDAFMQRTVGNATTVTFGSNGTPIATSSAPLGSASLRGGGWTNTAEGVFFESNGSARLPDGRGTVPVTSRIKASAPVIGRALYRGAAAFSLLGIGFQAGTELYDIWSELGYSVNADGSIASPDGQSTVSDGFEYKIPLGRSTSDPWYATREAACEERLEWSQLQFPSRNYTTWEIINPTTCRNTYVTGSGTFNVNSTISSRASSCPAGSYITTTGCTSIPPSQSITEQQFLDDIASRSGWPTSTAQALASSLTVPSVAFVVAQDLEALPETQTDVRFRTGTASIQVGEPILEETVTTNPDGSTVTRTSTRTIIATTTANQIRSSEEITTTTTTRDSTGVVTGVTTSTSSSTIEGTEPAPSPQEIELCGLPNTPPCKIDETGTSEPLPDDGQTVAESILQTLQQCADDLSACLPEMPDISWTFSLPTGCAPIVLGGGFEQYVDPIDICQWQPLFHDLMSMIWAGVGLFGAVALFRPRG